MREDFIHNIPVVYPETSSSSLSLTKKSFFTAEMPREAEPSANEKAFVLQALQEGIRLDGRAFDQYRTLELNFGDEHGVADVSLGKTR